MKAVYIVCFCVCVKGSQFGRFFSVFKCLEQIAELTCGLLGCATQLNRRPFLCPQYQGARDPGDEQASSEPEEEEAHLRARGQQTAPVAG